MELETMSLHSMGPALLPHVKKGDLTGFTQNAIELPDHFNAVVKEIRAVCFGACPECLADAGHGEKGMVNSPDHPHKEGFTPDAWTGAMYEIWGQLQMARLQHERTGMDFNSAYKLQPAGSAPVAGSLKCCPINIALGQTILWPTGMLKWGEDDNRGALDPNVNLCIICPEHGSVWSTIAPEMLRIVVQMGKTPCGSAFFKARPWIIHPIDATEYPDHTYDPDKEIEGFRHSVKIRDFRTEKERAATYGYISANAEDSEIGEPSLWLLFPFVDEVDEIAAGLYLKEARPELAKLKTYRPRPWEGNTIKLGRVLRQMFEMAAVAPDDEINVQSVEQRRKWESERV